MPLKSGSSQSTISGNIRELHGGNTYAKTAAKFGKKKANAQAVAIALDKARGRSFGGRFNMLPEQQAPGMMAAPGLQSVSGVAPPAANGPGMSLPPQAMANPPLSRQGVPWGVAGAPFAAGGGIAGFDVGARAPKAKTNHKITKGSILSAVPGRTDAHKTSVPSGSYVIPADIVSGRGEGNTMAGAQNLEKLFRMGPYGSSAGSVKAGSGFPKVKPRARGGEVEDESHVGAPVRVDLAGGEIVVPPENIKAVVHHDLKTAHEMLDKWVVLERKKLRSTLAKLPGPVKE